MTLTIKISIFSHNVSPEVGSIPGSISLVAQCCHQERMFFILFPSPHICYTQLIPFTVTIGLLVVIRAYASEQGIKVGQRLDCLAHKP